MNTGTFVRVATVIFTIVGLVHVYRALYALPLNLAGWMVPVELSWVAAVGALLLAYSGYKHWG